MWAQCLATLDDVAPTLDQQYVRLSCLRGGHSAAQVAIASKPHSNDNCADLLKRTDNREQGHGQCPAL